MTLKSKTQRYFKLFESCKLVQGISQSTICDLQRGAVKIIPNDLYEILNANKNESIEKIKSSYDSLNQETIEEYFRFLLEQEFIFICTKEELKLFPHINPKIEYSSLIDNAIVDWNIQSKHDFKKIAFQLNRLGCLILQLRFFSDISTSELLNTLRWFNGTRIVQIELVLCYKDTYDLTFFTELIYNCPRICSILIFNCPIEKERIIKNDPSTQMAEINFVNQELNSNSHCGFISPKYFVSNPGFYFESLEYNNCLNRKMSIDGQGEIKNCPYMKQSFGNIRNKELIEVIQTKAFQKVWKINKDSVDKCKDCEFRYVCSDCRAFTENDDLYAKPLYCNYNPYSGVWESPETDS